MGSQICKAELSHEGQNVSTRQIPQLSNPINVLIGKKRPFQKQILTQKKILRKYPEGIYEGPVNIMGNPSGYGKLYKNDNSLYIGNFSNGKADGNGILIFTDGSYTQGNFTRNFITKGQFVSQGFTYFGQFQKNTFHGQGQETNIKQGYQFQGKYNHSKKAQGTMKWKQDKIQYVYSGKFTAEGLFQNGGKLTEQPLGSYQGEFKNNRKHGKGTYQYSNGIKYIGQYVDGNKEGLGKLYNANGSISYQGFFKNGLPHGKGKAYNKQGKPVQTNWIQGIDQSIIS